MSDGLVERLRAAGCVFAEDEATALRSAFESQALATAIAQRIAGTPLEQVLGFTEIGGVRVDLGPGVFVPRARSTAIAETAAARHPDARIAADLGCGAGTLAAILSTRLPAARIVGTEIDPVAAISARRTGERHGFEVAEGSWWSPLPPSWRGRIDLAVAYLPHVPTGELSWIHADFRAHEPDFCVAGGPDGLDPWRAVARDAIGWLAPGSLFVTLVAREQRAEAGRIGEDAGLEIDYEESEDDLLLLASPSGR
ncbi:hypothetical protein BHE97_00600 [Aeromicrobium sp. PE09-221]|uniref:methyltransferase n=1 Tax=Aeromicrobium sp. PE09-221 TaxID=1898043 RepID=UPI000B6AD609|nr:methyltransferase [Aeromicrobium sp. PE09-221]OUZ12746.1 hypothetical protein BHE97_00600 [Aeromicrobium sp. PE09-221]